MQGRSPQYRGVGPQFFLIAAQYRDICSTWNTWVPAILMKPPKWNLKKSALPKDPDKTHIEL